MIVSVLINYKYDQMMNLRKFKLMCFQIDCFVNAYLPELGRYFREEGIEAHFYATQWLFTFFAADLDIDFVLIFFDIFLYEGF